MNKLNAVKLVTGLVVGSGVGKITKTIIDNNVQPETTLEKVLVFAGRMGISMTAGAIVARHVEHQIDEYASIYKKTTEAYQAKVESTKTP